ncbi:hypothetical protein B0H17DRAFT_1201886 [Mycena rosella]|uniref:BZIP domain-containing protein n=1 Tax=Mycena rosella TaxID=1033263 RepID=A0AAD7GI35_MYCRO|nr:hypothetical protein B0H17DRAFT_1201886 [Mycena rosella]
MSSPTPQLWATASKDWVIQPRPKPGQKSKKDLAPVQQQEEVDSEGKRVQNRAAQRAFRERKQSQFAALQARVQSYEQGEMERNVTLQSIAKRLKEENEALVRENAILKDNLIMAGQEHDIARDRNVRKHWRNHSPAPSVRSTKRKRYKVDDYFQDIEAPHFPTPTSPRRISPVLVDHPTDAFALFANLTSASAAFRPVDWACGEDTPCVCRNIFAGVSEHKLNINHVHPIGLGAPPQKGTTILDNLPPYQSPVPLRPRPRANTIFQAEPLSTPVNCLGDPSNCPARADNSFGKAFCKQMWALVPCDDFPCPSDRVGSPQPMPSQSGQNQSPEPEGADVFVVFLSQPLLQWLVLERPFRCGELKLRS